MKLFSGLFAIGVTVVLATTSLSVAQDVGPGTSVSPARTVRTVRWNREPGSAAQKAAFANRLQTTSANGQRYTVIRPQSAPVGSRVGVSRVVVQTKTAPKASPAVVSVAPRLDGVRPHSNGPTTTIVDAKDFGSAEIRGTPITVTLQYATPSATLTATSTAHQDFAITASSCTISGCTVTVKFTPGFPGLRTDAINLTDSNGTVIYRTFIRGIGLGPQFGYDFGNDSIYLGFTPSPQNVAIGPDERVYYTSTNSPTIYRALRDFSSADTITVNGLGSPSGIALDANNTLFVADQANNVIFTYSATGVQSTVTTSPLSSPSQIAIDGTGALYIADAGHGRIIRIDNQGAETTLVSGLATLMALALDSQGNLFYTAIDGNGGEQIFKLPQGSTTPLPISGLADTPYNLSVDPSGAIYVTTNHGLVVIRTGTSTGFGADGNDVSTGIAVDRNGDLFLTQPLKGNFSVSDRSHSNFILSAAPGSSSSGTLTIANTGNETLNFSGFSISGTVFSIDPSTTCSATGSIDANTACNVTVNFLPTAATTYHEVLTATSDSRHAPGTTDPFDIEGIGTGDESTTALTASPNPVQSGNPVTLLVSVIDNTGTYTPTGTVTFLDGATTVGTATLAAGVPFGTATAQFTVSGLSIGSHSITASYAGDNNVSPSTSTAVTVVATDGPPPPNGGVAVDSKNFGSVQVGQTISMNLSYAATAGTVYIEGLQDEDFVVTGTTCTTTCVATVSFRPEYPGLRSDIISVTDSNGKLVAKTFVYGNGVGPQFGFDKGDTEVRYGTAQAPNSVAVDIDGNAFVTDSATNQVYAFSVDYAQALPIVNLGTPSGIAIDAQSLLYIADKTHNLIVTYDTGTDQQGTVFTSQLSSPSGVAVDGAGSIYIADSGNGRVIRINNQGVETTLASGITALGPITVDSLGNVFYATTADPGIIVELPAGGGMPMSIANNISFIHGIAVDPGGRIYFTNDAGLSVLPVASCSGCPLEGIQLGGANTSVLNGVALGQDGDIYATSAPGGQFIRMRRSSSSFFTGANVGSSTQDVVVVANTGNAPLNFSSIAVAGNSFSIAPGAGCLVGTPLGAGITCTVIVSFHPAEAGSYNGTLAFTSDSRNDPSSGNYQDLEGTGSNGTQRGPTTTTLAANPSSATAGQTITLTATVNESTNIPPSGTVTFLDGGNAIGSANLGYQTSGGTATTGITTSTLTAGTHSITAMYAGDYNFDGSTSSPQTVVITAGSSGPAITSRNFGSVAVGQSTSMNIVYPQGTNPTITAVNNLDFTVSAVNCNTGCTATITFVPQYPGLRTDAVTVKDGNGNILAKTFLYGIGSAPQFGFNVGINTTYPNFVQQPTTIVLGADGTSFVSDIATNKVVAITMNQQGPLPINSLGIPAGLAIDGSNTLYVADQGSNVVRSYNLVTQAQGVVSTSPLSKPSYLAVDGTGALYISDTLNGRVIKLDNQGTETTLVGGLNSPQGIAVDSLGNFYYADAGSGGEIVELPALGGAAITRATQLGNVGQIAVDAAGLVYFVGDVPSVRVLLPSGIISGQSLGPAGSLSGVAVAPNGDIYKTQASTGIYAISTRSTTSGAASSPAGQSITTSNGGVINTGNASLTLSSLSFTTGMAFSIDPASGCVNGTVLAPGTMCNTVIDFLPPAAQTYNDRLTFTSNSLNNSASTNADTLTGTGTAVTLAPTRTSLSTTSNTPAIGQAVTFIATVSDVAGIGPTGTVNFLDGTTVIGSANLGLFSGNSADAQFTTSTLGIGQHQITAVYTGNSRLSGSTSNLQTVTISQTPTATALTLSAASITAGQTETLTATIQGAAPPTLTGTVTFFDGTTALGSANITVNGATATASFATSTLSVGNHFVSARYNGDLNYAASSAPQQTVFVGQASTSIALNLSATSITNGQPETLTATIQGKAAPVLTGFVMFFDGTTQIGSTAITVNGATATGAITVSNLATGSHSITAVYSGDTNYLTSTSPAQTVNVTQITSTATLAISAATITVGQSETLTATVQGAGTPALTGSVTFFDGTTQLGSSNISVNGATATAAFTATGLAVGNHSITARYGGDINYTASTSPAQTVNVAQAATTIALTAAPANISAGQNETLTATVQGLASPALTGSVTFFDGTTSLGNVNLSVSGANATATLATTTLAVGPHTITARYSGDSNYASSASAVQTVTVALVTQTITFPAIPNHVFGDAPFTLSATASSNLPVSYTVVSGPATISGSTVTITGAGSVSIQASQSGNATYAPATAVTQTFNVATATPMLTSLTPSTAVVGAAATTITLTGTNFASTDTVQLNGTGVATTFVSATSLTAILPANVLATAGTVQVRVFDSANSQTTAALPFTIVAAPAINFSGPTSSAPAQQPALTFQLVNPYPVPITGTLTLTFAPQSTALTDDPAVQFAAGGRTLTFTIPANSQTTPNIQLQTGTVAGRVTIALTVTANSVNVTPPNVVPVVITLPAAVPAISSAALARSGKTLTLTMQGYSNTRELTTATFHFTPASGASINNPDITADVTSAFAAWFSSAASAQYGSTFTYTQVFNLSDDANTIGSVTVTLVNSIGNSTTTTAQ